MAEWLYPDLPIIESLNRSSRRGRDVRLVVWHWTSGLREADVVARRDYRSSQKKVSAHFTIGRPGLIVQSVPLNLAAWHAGGSRFQGIRRVNDHSIGVEVCNVGYRRKRMEGKGIRWVRAEHENPRARRNEWEPYTEHQKLAIGALVLDLEDRYGPLIHTGHSDVRNTYAVPTAGWGKLDPGPLFPWEVISHVTRGGVYRYYYDERDWFLTMETQ